MKTVSLFAAVALIAGALLVVGAVADATPSRQSSTGFELGQPFPGLELPRLSDGSSGSLADYRGHKVILHIFASW